MEPISNANLQRQIREGLYRLKLEFGVKCDIYKMVSSATDYDTGLKIQDITKTEVRRVVKMPQNVARQQYISPYFTQTQKSFITKGLGWDEVTDLFIFDGHDIRGYDFDVSDWIVWNHVRYEVKEVEELGNKAGWAVWATQAKGSPPRELWFNTISQELEFVDSANGAPE